MLCYTRKRQRNCCGENYRPFIQSQKGHESSANQACDSAAWRGWWIDDMGSIPVVDWWVGHSQTSCNVLLVSYRTIQLHTAQTVGVLIQQALWLDLLLRKKTSRSHRPITITAISHIITINGQPGRASILRQTQTAVDYPPRSPAEPMCSDVMICLHFLSTTLHTHPSLHCSAR